MVCRIASQLSIVSGEMLQTDCTYPRHLDTPRQLCRATDVLLRPVQTLEDLALVRCERHQDLRTPAGHAHETDRRLGVALYDILEDDVNSIRLRVVAGWCVISIATALAIVHHDHYRFERHLGWRFFDCKLLMDIAVLFSLVIKS